MNEYIGKFYDFLWSVKNSNLIKLKKVNTKIFWKINTKWTHYQIQNATIRVKAKIGIFFDHHNKGISLIS